MTEVILDDEESWLYGDNDGDKNDEDPATDSGSAKDIKTEPNESEAASKEKDGSNTSLTNGDSGEQATSGGGGGDEGTNNESNKEGGDTANGTSNNNNEIDPNAESDDDDDDDSDDDVQVTIGDITSGVPSAGNKGFPIAGGGSNQWRTPVQVINAPKTTGIAKGVDLNAPGNINGVAVMEVSLDSFEDAPWRKPGADVSDYFNYGFNEVTWRLYQEKQRKIRQTMNDPMELKVFPIQPSPAQHTTTTNVTKLPQLSGLSSLSRPTFTPSTPATVKYDPPKSKFENTVRSISTLQFSRRADEGLKSPVSNQTNTVAAPQSTQPGIFPIPPQAPGTLPLQFDPSKPPPTLPLGIPPPGFPPPGAPQGLLPPGIRPPAPGPGILPLPLNLPPNPNFLVQQQVAGQPPPANPFFNNTDVPMDGPHAAERQSEERYHSGGDDDRYEHRSRRDYDRDRSRERSSYRGDRRSEYRDERDRDQFRDRDYDKDRDRDRDRGDRRDRDRDRDRIDRGDRDRGDRVDRERDRSRERRRKEESPTRHKTSRRKYEDEDKYRSSRDKHTKKAKKHHKSSKSERAAESNTENDGEENSTANEDDRK